MAISTTRKSCNEIWIHSTKAKHVLKVLEQKDGTLFYNLIPQYKNGK